MSKKITYVAYSGETIETTSAKELAGVLILFVPILAIVGALMWALGRGTDIGDLVMMWLICSSLCLIAVPCIVLGLSRWDAISKWYRDFVIAKDGWYPITLVVIGILYVVAFAACLLLGWPS